MKEKIHISFIKRKHKALYQKIIDEGWEDLLNEFDIDFVAKHVPNGFWTLDKLKQEALQYSTRSEFSIKSGSAYNIASKKGVLSEICSHMKGPKYNYWTLDKIDEIKKLANSCSTRTEFQKTHKAAYRFVYDNNLLDDLMPSKNKTWTLEMCKNDANKHTTKGAWTKSGTMGYFHACKNGWIEICCSHMPKNNVKRNIFTLEECKQEAAKHKKKGDWSKASPSTYGFAYKNGWFKKCCSHMIRTGPQGKSKPVYQYDVNLKLIKIWNYATEISKSLKITPANILSAASYNKNKPSTYKLRKGYIFSYLKLNEKTREMKKHEKFTETFTQNPSEPRRKDVKRQQKEAIEKAKPVPKPNKKK